MRFLIKPKGGQKMKRYLPIIASSLFMFIPAILFGQTKGEEKLKEQVTKIEVFSAKKGKLIIKDFYKYGSPIAGNVRGIDFGALIVYEPGMESNKVRGLRIEIYESGSSEESSFFFLDLDEVESLSKALKYMIDLAAKWKGQKREAYTEVVFSTRGDFQIGFYQKENDRSLFVTSGYINKKLFAIGADEIVDIKDRIDKGLSLLKTK
jgi:hypothetical protein